MTDKNNVYVYAPPRLFTQTPHASALSILMDDLWIHNTPEEINFYIETVIKPLLNAFTETQLDKIEKIGIATQTIPGLIKMATPEEAQQGIKSEVALSPQTAAQAYVDKNTFERIQEDIKARLREKVTADLYRDVSAAIDAFHAQAGDIDSLELFTEKV